MCKGIVAALARARYFLTAQRSAARMSTVPVALLRYSGRTKPIVCFPVPHRRRAGATWEQAHALESRATPMSSVAAVGRPDGALLVLMTILEERPSSA